MHDSVIQVERLGKQYRIGTAAVRHDTLRDAIVHVAGAPARSLRRVRPAGRGLGNDAERADLVWALRDVSFDVRRGEVLGIVGRNGAGKSTVLKILSRVTEPTTGRAAVHGQVGSLLEVGTGFHPELTGRENVFLNGAILGMERSYIERHFDEIIDFSGVERFIDTPVKRYSSGMKVRLAFAVAAHLQPEILIIDEVLAVGDVGFQKKCLGKMQDIAGGGRTILFVSHNMAAVRSLCSRCLLMQHGEIYMEGSPDAVVDRYLELYEEVDSQTDRTSLRADREHGGNAYTLHYTRTAAATTIECGQPVTLAFEVEMPKASEQATVSLTFINSAGDLVVSMSNKVQNVPSSTGPSRRWAVVCDLGQLPLNAGSYGVRVHVGDGMRDVARFGNAFVLHVREHDVFGWGNALPGVRSWGPMYWTPAWDIHPAR
ncbi:MAG TPA: polysaccharide ABC transporter ATP-binding protein [Gemmatimonadaceae bacterium]|nr:polysaccharide ABC transporter ATP-binding protein [Gemmatimonadaceae bacterium]